MLAGYRAALKEYFNSRWAWRIFVASSVALIIGSFVLFSMLGFGNHGGGTGTAGPLFQMPSSEESSEESEE